MSDDLIPVSPYGLPQPFRVPLGVEQNPTADEYEVDLATDPYTRPVRTKGKIITGDGPHAKERHRPVDPHNG